MEASAEGFFGEFGGAYIPEMLHRNIDELRSAYREIVLRESFAREYELLLCTYAGRPTPLYHACRLSERYRATIFLKREDLLHTGSHKINNALAQVLLAREMGKRRIIAETGAGQHGVATATVCALLGMPCAIYMGAVDIERQSSNVKRIKLLGASVVPVTSGSQTLKDATSEAMRDWMARPVDTYYLVGSTVGPHPYPEMVSLFHSCISKEIKDQLLATRGDPNPDVVIACVGGGSNAMGAFYHFIPEATVELIGVEAEGLGIATGKTAASIAGGSIGVLHGSKTILLQDSAGQILEPHSISAGLDYPGIGPQHAELSRTKRVRYLSATDDEAVRAGIELSRLEGIIPALETAHAFAALSLEEFSPGGKTIVINLSGRGDKDVEQYNTAGAGYL